jgi:hypothetical protein
MGEAPPKKFTSNCEEVSLIACLIMGRNGYETQIEIQKTPWSTDQGIYHSQCQIKIEGEWKYIVLDNFPSASLGQREYGEGVEYWTIQRMIDNINKRATKSHENSSNK